MTKREKKSGSQDEPLPKRQKTLEPYFQSSSQSQVDQKVYRYIVKEALPISTVTKATFRELMEDPNHNTRVMGEVKLKMLISTGFDEFKTETIESMSRARIICLTCDGWSNRRRSFLGVTAHWFDARLGRKSAALSCQRLKGIYT